MKGAVLPDSADNVDLEAIVRLSDGSFWIAEEMGPSIALVSADGRILRRHVPANAAADYKDADAEIVANLPAILSKRQGNRGFESIAISPDERFLYLMMQNALANPDAAAFNAARNVRLFKLERQWQPSRRVGVSARRPPELWLGSIRPAERSADLRDHGARPRSASRAGADGRHDEAA